MSQPVGERDPETGLPLRLPTLAMGRQLSPTLGTLSNSNSTNPQQTTLVFGQQGGVSEEYKQRERTGSSSNAAAAQGEQGGSSNNALLMQMMHNMQLQQQEQAELSRQWQREQAVQARQWQQAMAEQSQLIAELRAGRATAGMQARSAADTLPTPRPSFRYPTTAARNGVHNRPSFGIPTNPFHSPTARRDVDAEYPDEYEHEVADRPEAAVSSAPTEWRRDLKDILAMMKGLVQPFYADKEKDKNTTVLDFVEKIETVMADIIPDQPQYRWTMVRFFLAEGANRWGNEFGKQAEKAGRDLRQDPLDWDSEVRAAFIRAHVGTDTARTWLAKLTALRLGTKKTPTPIELESQFDSIARHIYPASAIGDTRDDLLLATSWATIISLSQPEMHKHIVTTLPPRSLAEWKERTVMHWNGLEELKASHAYQRAMSGTADTGRAQSGWRGRGGHGSRGGEGPTLHAASGETDDGTGKEGEPNTEQAPPTTPQLSAAAGTGQRGGRGGRGGRGRGGAIGQRKKWSAEQRQRFIDGLCMECGESGHIARSCPKANGGQ